MQAHEYSVQDRHCWATNKNPTWIQLCGRVTYGWRARRKPTWIHQGAADCRINPKFATRYRPIQSASSISFPLTSYNQQLRKGQGWDVKAKNELPETAYPAHSIGHLMDSCVQVVNEHMLCTRWMAAHAHMLWSYGSGLRCMCLWTETAALGCQPDRYLFKPRSVVAVSSHQDGRYAEAGCEKWKCSMWRDCVEQLLHYLS